MSTNWKVSGWISSCCTLHIEVCLGKMLGCMAQILISLNQWFPPTVCCSSFTIYQIELWRMWVEKQKPIHIFLLPFSEISICNSWCHLSNHCVLNSFHFFFFYFVMCLCDSESKSTVWLITSSDESIVPWHVLPQLWWVCLLLEYTAFVVRISASVYISFHTTLISSPNICWGSV